MRIPKPPTEFGQVRHFRFWVTGLAFAAISTGLPVTHALEFLYSDNFSGSGANLAGTTPDTTIGSNTWQGNTGFKANGSVSTVVGGIYLPFAATSGNIYTMTAVFSTASSSTGWIGAGFSGGDPASPNPLNSFGRGWVIVQKVDKIYQSFIGSGTSGGASAAIVDPVNQLSTLTVTLNASSANAANWTFSSTLRVNTTD